MTTGDAVTAQTRTVRVRTEVAALDKTFDYAVPARWSDDVRVGTRVRVPLHGRSLRGWVVEADVATPDGIDLLPLKSWLGWGPPSEVLEVAEWASWRWAGPASVLLARGLAVRGGAGVAGAATDARGTDRSGAGRCGSRMGR